MSQLKSKPPSVRKRKTTKEENCLFDEEPPSKLFRRGKIEFANFRREDHPLDTEVNVIQKTNLLVKPSGNSSKF